MIFNSLTSLIFSDRCLGCDRAIGPICSDCSSQLHFLQTPAQLPHLPRFHFTAAFSCLAYEGRLLEWLHQFKYHRQFYFSKLFAKWLAGFDLDWRALDFLVPVPLYWFKHLRRGFNPSHLLAYRLGQTLDRSVLPCLKKRKATPPQTELSRAERLKNVQGSFAVLTRAQSRIVDKSLLLVDDVLTTGATVNECARVLKKAGAKQVSVLTLARTL